LDDLQVVIHSSAAVYCDNQLARRITSNPSFHE